MTSYADHTLLIGKVVTDEASLRHEFRVSMGRNPRKSIKNPPLRHFACILRHNIAFSPLKLGTRASVRQRLAGTTFNLIITSYARTLTSKIAGTGQINKEIYMGQFDQFCHQCYFFVWCLRDNNNTILTM